MWPVPASTTTIQALGLLFGGCCTNILTLESVIHTGLHGYTLTFLQFLTATLFGYFVVSSRRTTPIHEWLKVVVMFWSSSVLNNAALNQGVSVPLQTIVRSATPVGSLLLSRLLLKKRHTWSQVLAVSTVTLGVLLSTINQFDAVASGSLNKGIPMLVLSMLIVCLMGLIEERIRDKYRSHPSSNWWKESLFYTHALSLPLYGIRWGVLARDWEEANASMVGPLLGNLASQLICIIGVRQFLASASGLSLSLALVARKVISLTLSGIFFEHAMTAQEIVGASMVFAGGVWYANASREKPMKKARTLKKEA